MIKGNTFHFPQTRKNDLYFNFQDANPEKKLLAAILSEQNLPIALDAHERSIFQFQRRKSRKATFTCPTFYRSRPFALAPGTQERSIFQFPRRKSRQVASRCLPLTETDLKPIGAVAHYNNTTVFEPGWIGKREQNVTHIGHMEETRMRSPDGILLT